VTDISMPQTIHVSNPTTPTARPAFDVARPALPGAPARLARTENRGGWHEVRYSWRWLSAALAGGATAWVGLAELAALPYGPFALAAGGALGLLGAGYTAVIEPTHPVLERLVLRFKRLPPQLHGLRVMQLSDLHLGTRYSEGNVRQAVAMVKREQPDLVLFTGDFVSVPEPIAQLPELLRGITAPLGCYAVLGNHDYWEGPQEIVDGLQAVGIELLHNTHRRLEWRGASLYLLGVDEPWSGRPDFDAALRGVPSDAFKLLMAHVPEAGDEAAARGIDLQLSGHSHGGHLALPLLGPMALPTYGTRYERGLHQVGATTVYTNRGLAGKPYRLNCPPEVTLITLQCA
jgi:uncharacterized protein